MKSDSSKNREIKKKEERDINKQENKTKFWIFKEAVKTKYLLIFGKPFKKPHYRFKKEKNKNYNCKLAIFSL